MDKKRTETAVMFARMYGVAETLEPLQRMDWEPFIEQILSWTEDYLESGRTDILSYFEEQITKIKKTER